MKLSHIAIAGSLLLGSCAHAATMQFTGNIQDHNDVIITHFTLDNDATDVRIWTDSYQSGTNFDPITALWKSNGDLIDEDDDNDSINPTTQTGYDSGFSLDNLAAGDYFFTVATYNNWAQGSTFADGFKFDSQSAIALQDWTQPSNGLNMGSFWSVWLDGVDSAYNDDADNSVPEPASIAIFGLVLAGLGFSRKQKRT